MHSGHPNVDSSNLEQLRAWDGTQGEYWIERADRFDEGLAAYQERLLDAAHVSEHTTALDIGCGTGKTTRDIARLATGGHAHGVDLSSGMLELARTRARQEGVDNVAFEQADAQIHPFSETFDLAVSRHGAMFFGDPPAAFANIAAALRPGGRLVLLSWQSLQRNEWISTLRQIFAGEREAAAPGPGSLSDPERVSTLLAMAGFTGVRIEPLHEPMFLGDDVEDAERFVTGQFGWMLREADAAAASRARERLRESLRAHQVESGVFYGSAAWLTTADRSR